MSQTKLEDMGENSGLAENFTRVKLKNLCDFSSVYSASGVPCFICKTENQPVDVNKH
jgi:hypothetical protein